MTDRVPETWVKYGFRKCHGEIGLRQVDARFFYTFCQTFVGIFDGGKNLAKNVKKSLVQHALSPFFD